MMLLHWGHCWSWCRDIAIDVDTLRRSFLLSSRNFFTCFPYFISAISVQAREYKSISIKKKILNSSMNSNTQIFNSAYSHCIA